MSETRQSTDLESNIDLQSLNGIIGFSKQQTFFAQFSHSMFPHPVHTLAVENESKSMSHNGQDPRSVTSFFSASAISDIVVLFQMLQKFIGSV